MRRSALLVLVLVLLAGVAGGQDRLAAARREGKVVWHSAGIKNADVVNTSDTGHYVFLKRKGLLAASTLPTRR